MPARFASTTAMTVDPDAQGRLWRPLDSALEQALDALPQDANAVACWVALSGGADSTALLHTAVRVLGATRVRALHVNHNISEQSSRWQADAEAACKRLGVACRTVDVEVSEAGSLEAAARAARYEVFEAVLREPENRGACLLLAHHRQDAAETVLLKLFQGRPVKPMPATRQLGDGLLIRPFLGLDRSALQRAVVGTGLDWVEDESNLDLRFDRNALRQAVLPLVRSRFGDVDTTLVRLGERFADQDEAIAELMARAELQGPGSWAMQLSAVNELSQNTAALVLRRFLEQRGVLAFTDRQLAELVSQLRSSKRLSAAPALLSNPVSLRTWRGALWLCRSFELAERYPMTTEQLELPHGTLAMQPISTSLLDAETDPETGPETDPETDVPGEGALSVGFVSPSARLTLIGRSGSKPLKQWLSEHGVPPWLRSSYPVLLRADVPYVLPGVGRVACPTPASQAFYERVVWTPENGF